jgi:sugar phosphate isomerase/epimerase
MMDRRHFLHTTLAGAALGATAKAAHAIEPIRRTGRPLFKLALAAYSFRQALDLKQTKPAMTLLDFIDYSAGLPLDGVELTGYYFAETTPGYLAALKGRATRLGLDISGTAVRSDFCLADEEQRKLQIEHVKRWTEITARLGGKTMRIFAGTTPRGDTDAQAVRRCIDAVQECCAHAGQWGVLLALENHGGITATADLTLEIVRGVKSDWFGVNLDTGNFKTDDPYADLEKLAPYAVVVQLKTEIQRRGQKSEEADLKRKLDMLRKVNFRGYVVLEYEAAEDAKVAVPRYARQLREML